MQTLASFSWKTTLIGCLVLVAVSVAVKWGGMDLATAAPLFLIGVGLIVARDNNKTSEQVAAGDPPRQAPKLPPIAGGMLCLLFLSGCTPAQRRAANTIVTPFLPFACAELTNVMHGGVLVAQLCADQAKKAADILLAQSKGIGNGAGACGAHETIVDAHGAPVGWACESGGMADEIAASIGGRVVK